MQFFKLQDLYLHLIRIYITRFIIPKMNGPVTLDVIRKMHKVQDAHMNALLKLFIWFAFFDLTCKHPPHIKKNTLVPAFKVFDLHFHIHPGSICK